MRRRLTHRLLHLVLLSLLAAASATASRAQAQTVTGTVTDAETGDPLPGAGVLVEGTTIGAATDREGTYTVRVPSLEGTLVFSFIGYVTQEIPIDGQSVLDVALSTDTKQLEEVVVTALDLERSKDELGYSTQEVQGDVLTEARETNLVDALAGRVAGVNVTGGASGVGSSSRITIRGESSLAGDNQPLFVVDGIPINNATRSNRSEGNLEVDYGNGIADISPDDIESINVLKGPNAAALYGSRAANGVVVITTKSGQGRPGLGVSFNSNATFERPLRIPEYQNAYGQGSNFEFRFVDGSGAGLNDGVDESWGPPLDGRLIPQHDSPAGDVRAADVMARDGAPVEATPWVAHPGNVEDFFETGYTLSNNIAVSGSNDRGDFRLSYTNLTSEGILPNTDLERNTFNLNTGYDLTDRLRVEAVANYLKSGSDNRPNNSYGTENVMYLWVWFGRQIDMASLRDYWQPGHEDVQQFNYNYNWHDNPYFTMFENTNGFSKDRLVGSLQATYDVTDALSLKLGASIDYFDELREVRRAFSTQRFPFGQYREDEFAFEERNFDVLLSYSDAFRETFTVSASVGGNRLEQDDDYLRVAANQLSIPGVYNFSNARIPLETDQLNAEKRVNSLYGTAQIGYKNLLFLDLTARNDWSSTLPLDDNSYFYPSASVSAIVSDMLDFPDGGAFNYAKLRFGWAQVGNDTDPYRLRNIFAFQTPWGATQLLSEDEAIANPNLKPETVTTYEVGTELGFLGDRLRLDLAYYDIRSRDQILEIPIPISTGYTSQFINAGEIRNHGVEAVLNATPVRLRSGFSWDVGLNWDWNRSEVRALAEGLTTYQIAENYVSIEARLGERMGSMYGTGIRRVADPESPFFGQMIWSEGYPVPDPELRRLGNYNPDWTAGIFNSFAYKHLSLDVLFDVRYGGEVMSRTLLIGSTSGMLEETLRGREEGIIGEGARCTGTLEGSACVGGEWVANDVRLQGREYFWSLYNRDNEEMGIYDASYVKLREVKLSYTLPGRFVRGFAAQRATISLVGRNLLLWTENPHFDPELVSFSGGQLVPGVEDMATPSSRSIGVNVRLEF